MILRQRVPALYLAYRVIIIRIREMTKQLRINNIVTIIRTIGITRCITRGTSLIVVTHKLSQVQGDKGIQVYCCVPIYFCNNAFIE